MLSIDFKPVEKDIDNLFPDNRIITDELLKY